MLSFIEPDQKKKNERHEMVLLRTKLTIFIVKMGLINRVPPEKSKQTNKYKKFDAVRE